MKKRDVKCKNDCVVIDDFSLSFIVDDVNIFFFFLSNICNKRELFILQSSLDSFCGFLLSVRYFGCTKKKVKKKT